MQRKHLKFPPCEKPRCECSKEYSQRGDEYLPQELRELTQVEMFFRTSMQQKALQIYGV